MVTCTGVIIIHRCDTLHRTCPSARKRSHLMRQSPKSSKDLKAKQHVLPDKCRLDYVPKDRARNDPLVSWLSTSSDSDRLDQEVPWWLQFDRLSQVVEQSALLEDVVGISGSKNWDDNAPHNKL